MEGVSIVRALEQLSDFLPLESIQEFRIHGFIELWFFFVVFFKAALLLFYLQERKGDSVFFNIK